MMFKKSGFSVFCLILGMTSSVALGAGSVGGWSFTRPTNPKDLGGMTLDGIFRTGNEAIANQILGKRWQDKRGTFSYCTVDSEYFPRAGAFQPIGWRSGDVLSIDIVVLFYHDQTNKERLALEMRFKNKDGEEETHLLTDWRDYYYASYHDTESLIFSFPDRGQRTAVLTLGTEGDFGRLIKELMVKNITNMNGSHNAKSLASGDTVELYLACSGAGSFAN